MHCRPKPKPKPLPKPRPPSASSAKCMMCTTEPVGVVFRPCGHSVACVECSSRMKQCFSCHERIQEKVRVEIVLPPTVAKCMNCATEPVGVIFRPCGHRAACVECSRRMKLCIECHQTIQEKVNVSSGELLSRSCRKLTSRDERLLTASYSVVFKQSSVKQHCLEFDHTIIAEFDHLSARTCESVS